jgi:hypothetical protein
MLTRRFAEAPTSSVTIGLDTTDMESLRLQETRGSLQLAATTVGRPHRASWAKVDVTGETLGRQLEGDRDELLSWR